MNCVTVCFDLILSLGCLKIMHSQVLLVLTWLNPTSNGLISVRLSRVLIWVVDVHICNVLSGGLKSKILDHGSFPVGYKASL